MSNGRIIFYHIMIVCSYNMNKLFLIRYLFCCGGGEVFIYCLAPLDPFKLYLITNILKQLYNYDSNSWLYHRI